MLLFSCLLISAGCSRNLRVYLCFIMSITSPFTKSAVIWLKIVLDEESYNLITGAHDGAVALRYKPEGHGFDSR
jgi:hypothetical protein